MNKMLPPILKRYLIGATAYGAIRQCAYSHYIVDEDNDRLPLGTAIGMAMAGGIIANLVWPGMFVADLNYVDRKFIMKKDLKPNDRLVIAVPPDGKFHLRY
jgi:hypothetical protein